MKMPEFISSQSKQAFCDSGEATFLLPVLVINPVKMLNIFKPLLTESANYSVQQLTIHAHRRAECIFTNQAFGKPRLGSGRLEREDKKA